MSVSLNEDASAESISLKERNAAARELMDRLGVSPITDENNAANMEVDCVNGDSAALEETVTQGRFVVAVVEVEGSTFILGPMKGYQYRQREKRGTFALLSELTGVDELDGQVQEVPLVFSDGSENPRATELLRNQQWLKETTDDLLDN